MELHDPTRRHAGWSLMAAAAAAALYAGFRFNECLGTDLVLAREPASVALGWLQLLNSKRTPAVTIMVSLSLVTGVIAVRRAQPRRTAALGLSLLLVEDVLTAVHVPLVLLLQGLAPEAAPVDWGWLRTRYVLDDVVRTALLAAAAIAFIGAGIRNIESASHLRPEKP